MNRRHFLQSLTAYAGGLTLAANSGQADTAAAAKSAVTGFRYLLASAMYGNLPIATILPEVSKTGSIGIDLWPKVHGTQRNEMDTLGHDKVAEMLAAHSVKLECTTRYDLGPFRLDDEIAVLKRFGGSIIVTGGAGNYKVTGEELKAEVRGFVEKLKPSAAKAAEAGVTIAIENHGKNLIDSPESLRWLAEFAVPGIGIALAPYHLPQDPALLSALIRDLGPRLTLFYAWEHGKGCMKPMPKAEELEQMPGRGPFDFKPVLQALQSISFKGPIEIFMHPTPRGFPILETADLVTEEINRSRAHLASLLA